MQSQKKLQQLQRLPLFATTLASTVGVATLYGLTPAVHAAPETSKSADTLVDSMGVATHLRYSSTAYGKYNEIIKPRLQELGIRHIRDGGKDSTFNQKLKDLATIGIKSTLVMDPRDGTLPGDAVAIAKAVPQSIVAVEGPNETDLKNFSYNGKSFPQATRDYQNALYTAIKGDAATKYLPVLMPSMGQARNSDTLGYLNSGDMGNMHSYAANGTPPTDALDSWYIKYARVIAGPSKPLVATETGYHNAINNPSSASAISEQASSKYLLRLHLEYFNRGIKRAFLYEFINQSVGTDQEQNFGLLRHDGSRKPAFIALKNLIYLMKEPGAKFTPGSLDYTLSGDTTNVHHTLVQKSGNGQLPTRFFLILWQEVKSWDNTNKKDIAVPDRKLTLNLNTVIRRASVYQPLTSITPTSDSTSPSGGRINQLTLSVPDHPLVIRLIP
jgi:hypothetical protein